MTKREEPQELQETGLSVFHKLVLIFFKSHYSTLKPKLVYYRNYKNFRNSNFLKDLSNNFFLDSDDLSENYNFLTTKFQKAVNRHAPLKKKILRGDHSTFIDKEFRKVIHTRSRLRNKFLKNPTKANESLFKKQRSKCVLLRKKCIKYYFRFQYGNEKWCQY